MYEKTSKQVGTIFVRLKSVEHFEEELFGLKCKHSETAFFLWAITHVQ